MKNIFFNSTFAVAMHGDFPFNINWIGTLTSSNNKVDVIIFKADTNTEFLPLIEADLTALAQEDQNDPNVQNQINWLNKIKNEITQRVFHKTPDNNLIKAVELSIKQTLTTEKYTYLSGVSSIIE